MFAFLFLDDWQILMKMRHLNFKLANFPKIAFIFHSLETDIISIFVDTIYFVIIAAVFAKSFFTHQLMLMSYSKVE